LKIDKFFEGYVAFYTVKCQIAAPNLKITRSDWALTLVYAPNFKISNAAFRKSRQFGVAITTSDSFFANFSLLPEPLLEQAQAHA
jgi:hypothetical protein